MAAIAGASLNNPIKSFSGSPRRSLKLKHQVIARLLPKDNKLENELQDLVDEKLRYLNVQITCLSWSALAVCILYHDICFDVESRWFSDAYENCDKAYYGQIFAWTCNIISIWRLIVFYRVHARNGVITSGFSTSWECFTKTRLWKECLLEIVIAILCPPISKKDNAFRNTFLLFVMCLARVYLGLRCIRDWSLIYRERRNIRRQLTKYKKFSYEVNFSVVLKTFFYENTPLAVLGSFIIMVSLISYFVFLSEREYWTLDGEVVKASKVGYPNSDLSSSAFGESYFWCVWFTIVTMTTLGYGDISPLGWQGRFITCVGIILGLILSSLLVGVVTNKLEPTKFQQLVIEWLKLRQLEDLHQRCCTRIIQEAWRTHENIKVMNQNRKLEGKVPLAVARRKMYFKSTIRPHYKKMRKNANQISQIKIALQGLNGNQFFHLEKQVEKIAARMTLFSAKANDMFKEARDNKRRLANQE